MGAAEDWAGLDGLEGENEMKELPVCLPGLALLGLDGAEFVDEGFAGDLMVDAGLELGTGGFGVYCLGAAVAAAEDIVSRLIFEALLMVLFLETYRQNHTRS